jgi:hypothetical protein
MLESINDFTDCMAQGLDEAKTVLNKEKDKYIMYYNCQYTPAPVLSLGDKVWLDGSNITTTQSLSKLAHQQLGPFTVEACIGHGAYVMKVMFLLFPLTSLLIYSHANTVRGLLLP